MSLLTEDKITEIFCLADEFCKEYSQSIQKNKIFSPSRRQKEQEQETQYVGQRVMTILMLYHFGSFKCFKHFYLMYIGNTLKKEFPHPLSYFTSLIFTRFKKIF